MLFLPESIYEVRDSFNSDFLRASGKTKGSDDTADDLLDLYAQVVGAEKLSPFVEWTLTGEKYHLGGISNGHMVVPRRLMETGRIEALDQGVILAEVQGAESSLPFLPVDGRGSLPEMRSPRSVS